jgi:hypothetical protein
MSSYQRIGLGVPLVCWVAFTATALPQTPQEAPPVFSSEIALVAVPVFVTDKSGQAVAGLTAADFEVEDGGRRVPLAAFHAVDVHAEAAVAGGVAENSNPLGQPLDVAVRERMDRLFQTAGRSDVVIHSVNLGGLQGPVDVASRTGQNLGRGGAPTPWPRSQPTPAAAISCRRTTSVSRSARWSK